MKTKRLIFAGFAALFAAWLSLGQAALVYAVDPPAPAAQTVPQTQPQTAPTSSTQAAPTVQPASGTTPQSSGDLIVTTCPASSVLSWIICPFVNAALATLNKIAGLVIDMLQIRPVVQDNSLYAAWQAFRNLADIGFILVFMVIIFSTVLSINNSAYQIKTLLPKLIAGAILVQFSFFLSAIAVDVGNVLGAGVSGIFNQLGTQGGQTVAAHPASAMIGGFVAILAAVAVGFIVTWPFVLLLLALGVLSLLGVFFTLAARQLLIAVLIIISPLAFIAWILPGTEKYFKLWYTNLIRVILLYPLIVVILSVGGLLTRAAAGTTNTFGTTRDIDTILASIVPIIAFLSIPATFKWAGGMMSWTESKVRAPFLAANRGLKRSQLAQDIKATRVERGFTNARDIKGTSFGQRTRRGAAKLQAGQFWWQGSPSKRRLAKGYDAALGAQMDDWGHIFDDQQFGNADLMNQLIVDPSTGNVPHTFSYQDASGKKHSFRINKAMRAQALAQIVKQGGMLEVSQIYNQLFDQNADPRKKGEFKDPWGGMPGNEVTDMWYRGLGASGKMGEVVAAIPMVNPGKRATAFDTMSASSLASMHGSAAEFFIRRIMSDAQPNANEAALGKTVASMREERAHKLLSNLGNIASSPDMRGRVDQQTMKRFKDAVTPGAQDVDPLTGVIIPTYDAEFHNLMQTLTVTVRGTNMSGMDFFNTYVTNDGKIQS